MNNLLTNVEITALNIKLKEET